MTVQQVNQPKPTQNKARTQLIVGSTLVGGAATAAGTYFLAPVKLDGKNLLALSDDKFVKTFAKIPAEKKSIVDLISQLRKNLPEAIKLVESDLAKLMGDKKEISKDDFIKNMCGDEYETAEAYENAVKKVSEDTPKLKEELKSAQEFLEKATESTKQVAEEKFINARLALEENLEIMASSQNIKKALDSAKNNMIPIETATSIMKSQMTNELKAAANNSAKNLLAFLEKDVPKIRSGKRATVSGGIAAVVIGGIITVLTRHKKPKNAPKA